MKFPTAYSIFVVKLLGIIKDFDQFVLSDDKMAFELKISQIGNGVKPGAGAAALTQNHCPTSAPPANNNHTTRYILR